MRITLLFGLLLFLSIGSYGQIIVNGRERFKTYEDKQIKNRLREVVRRDSTKNDQTELITFNSFDISGSLVEKMEYYQYQNDSRRAYFLRNVYNNRKQIILHELFNMYGGCLERFKYTYNDKGKLIDKKIVTL